MEDEILVCERCDQAIQSTDEYCPHCGGLFIEGVKCQRHPSHNAAGVCVLCSVPCCADCGETAGGRFLCSKHISFEIVGEMACVWAVNNSAMADYFQSCLEEGGFHPFVYTAARGHRGSLARPTIATTLAECSMLGRGGEFKLMVPFQEVEKAEAFLAELNTGRP